MANTKNSNVWTEEELKLANDTDCPLTLAGERRCAYRYNGIDCCCLVERRCINAAAVRIHLPAGTAVNCLQKSETGFDAAVCESCAARLQEPLPEFEVKMTPVRPKVTIIGRL